MAIQAICFDLFETLITEYIVDYQPSPTPADRLQIESSQFVRAWRKRMPARFRGELVDFAATLRDICQEVGVDAPAALIDELNAERLREKARFFDHIDPHILQMLATLRQRGLKLGLISNASREEVAAWPTCDLAAYFDVAIFSCDVGLIKPEPEIYVHTCEALGVAPHATLFIGDGGSHELMGAQRAGLTPYWATWFLEQWPMEKQATKQSPHQQQENAQFTRLVAPADLLNVVEQAQQEGE